jgi:two-component system, OmpR family, KDP operon response regulator KdpE
MANHTGAAVSRRLRRFTVGDRDVDLDAHLITAAGLQVHLTQIECKLLGHLVARLDETVPSQKLVDLVWGRDPKRGAHSLRSVVKNVRRKLEPDPTQPRFLLLDRTIGYRLRIS